MRKHKWTLIAMFVFASASAIICLGTPSSKPAYERMMCTERLKAFAEKVHECASKENDSSALLFDIMPQENLVCYSNPKCQLVINLSLTAGDIVNVFKGGRNLPLAWHHPGCLHSGTVMCVYTDGMVRFFSPSKFEQELQIYVKEIDAQGVVRK